MSQVFSVTTANIGMPVPSTGCPDYEPGNAVAMLTAAVVQLDNYVLNLQKYTGSGAISATVGKVFLTGTSVQAMTLAAPLAGQPSAGGQDGQELTIIAAGAYAHTVTTPANAINGSKHIATWTAAAGNSLKMTALGGVWYTDDPPNGVTLS